MFQIFTFHRPETFQNKLLKARRIANFYFANKMKDIKKQDKKLYILIIILEIKRQFTSKNNKKK